MVAEVIEELAVLADALLQPGALSRRQGGHVLAAPRALRLAHSDIVMPIRASRGSGSGYGDAINCARVGGRGSGGDPLRDYALQPVRFLLAFALMLLAGGSPSSSKPSVVFVGDSITVLATPAIHQLLDPKYDVEILAVIGIRINKSLPALESALKFHPDAVVVNLGTNDALQGGVHPAWLSSWDKLIRITRNTPCVVLTTVNPAADALSHRPIATKINAHIRASPRKTPRSTRWPIGAVS